MSNELTSTSTVKQIREHLGYAEEVSHHDLVDAVMILCRRVEELEKELKAKP